MELQTNTRTVIEGKVNNLLIRAFKSPIPIPDWNTFVMPEDRIPVVEGTNEIWVGLNTQGHTQLLELLRENNIQATEGSNATLQVKDGRVIYVEFVQNVGPHETLIFQKILEVLPKEKISPAISVRLKRIW